MHDAGGVCRGQCLEHRLEQCQGTRGGQGPTLAQKVAQGAPFDVLHDEVGGAGLGVAALVVDGHDLGCGQPGGRAGLLRELGHEPRVVGQGAVHHLDGDDPVETLVEADVDSCHAAARHDAVEAVPGVEQPADQGVSGAAHAGAGSDVHGP